MAVLLPHTTPSGGGYNGGDVWSMAELGFRENGEAEERGEHGLDLGFPERCRASVAFLTSEEE